mgnify:FL=1
MFYIETNANSGPDLGAGDAVSMCGILIDKHPQLKAMDYWVFANFDCVLHGHEATRALCQSMKDTNKIFASYFRQINVDMNEPVAPHSDWWVFDNNWNLDCDFFKKFHLIDQSWWLQERLGKYEGTELALLRLLSEELVPTSWEYYRGPVWKFMQIDQKHVPSFQAGGAIMNHPRILNLGLTDYRKNCQFFFHTHDMDEYQKWKQEVGL